MYKRQRFGGGGDFAYAYVISHEMGHHIQNQLGILPKVHQAQERAESRAEANALSVRIELMADCLAGVWAANGNAKRQFLEQGDVEKMCIRDRDCPTVPGTSTPSTRPASIPVTLPWLSPE